MSTLLPLQVDERVFPPLSPPPRMNRVVFDNGVEAEMPSVADRRTVPQDDRELLGACRDGLRDAPNVPKDSIVASVIDGTVILDGHTSYYFERAAAECAVRFIDGVRRVENHIAVHPLSLARGTRDATLRT